MNFFVVGLNHKTAPIAIRERFYLNSFQQDLFLSELRNNPAVIEVCVLSTCNRTEVFINRLDESVTPEKIVEMIARSNRIAYNSGLMGYFYTYTNDEAVLHLLRVTAGLDSLVLGEKQTLGQVRSAFQKSVTKGLFSKHF